MFFIHPVNPNQQGSIKTLFDVEIKAVESSTYLGSYINSIVKTWKSWTALN